MGIVKMCKILIYNDLIDECYKEKMKKNFDN